jgi:hypothetical protein
MPSTFDRFWNHKLSVPMQAFASGNELPDLDMARANADKKVIEASHSIYGKALDSPLMRDIAEDRVRLFPGDAQVITDDPDKLLLPALLMRPNQKWW